MVSLEKTGYIDLDLQIHIIDDLKKILTKQFLYLVIWSRKGPRAEYFKNF